LKAEEIRVGCCEAEGRGVPRSAPAPPAHSHVVCRDDATSVRRAVHIAQL